MNAEIRTILLATDADAVFREVDAALSDSRTRVLRVASGADVLPAIEQVDPDLVILDLQIGNMGGVAVSLAIRNEESAGRLNPQNVLLLLDRIADVFIANRSDADGWIVKPLNPLRLQRAATLVMNGEYYTEHLTVAPDVEDDDELDAEEGAANGESETGEGADAGEAGVEAEPVAVPEGASEEPAEAPEVAS